MTPVTGLVLAGGRSSRMGRNKARLELGGETLIQRAVRRLAEGFPEVMIVGGNPGEYSDLGVPVIPDQVPDCGPLGGLHAGLKAARNPYCFLVACDMPFAQPAMAGFFLERGGGADVVVGRVGQHLEPMHALYHRNCLGEIEIQLGREDLKIIAFYPRVNTVEIPEVELRARFGELEPIFSNINTPADYRGLIY